MFGISDNDEIVGLEDFKADSEFLSQKIKERIDPIPEINLQIKEINEKQIIILNVFSGVETPYYYTGDSVMQPYIRMVMRLSLLIQLK